jgi:hypothetical protein
MTASAVRVASVALAEAKMKNYLLAAMGAIFTLCNASVLAQSGAELELGGFTLGMGIERFDKDARYTCETARTAFADKTCRLKALESVNVVGSPVEFMTFMFLENRLYAITANLNPAEFNIVSQALQKKYGAPKVLAQAISPSAKAAGLPSNETDTLEWKSASNELLLRKVNMVGRTDLRLWSPQAMDKVVQKLSNKP